MPSSEQPALQAVAIARLRDWDVTARFLGHFPLHVSRRAPPLIKLLLRERVLHLPRDPRGVRLKLELATGRISQHSLELVCELLAHEAQQPSSCCPETWQAAVMALGELG